MTVKQEILSPTGTRRLMKQLGLAAVESSKPELQPPEKHASLELHNGLQLQSQLWVESMLEITIKSTENGKVTPSHGITNAVPCIYENTAK